MMTMSLVLRLPHDMHLCRSSSHVPRLPTCLKLLQNPIQKWREHVVLSAFSLPNALRATTACDFSSSQLPKVVQKCGALYIFNSTCASRHNDVHFFNISSSKSAPTLVCFVRFYFEMCFALLQHLIFQQCSDVSVCFVRFYFEACFEPQTACNCSSFISPDGSAPPA